MAHRDGDRDHSRGGVAVHLRGSDGVGVAASSSAVNGARDHTRVHVDRKSLRKGGRDGVVVDQLAVGVQLRHLDVLVDLEVLSRGQVLQVGDIHIERHAEQIQTVEAPTAGLGRAGEVLEAVLVPRLVLLDVDHLALAHQRPGQSRHLLQRRPLFVLTVARLQVESHGLAVLLHVVELHRHSADPLATVVVEGDLEAVGLAHHAVIEVEVVVLEEVVVLALTHALSSDGERAEHTGLGGDAHEAHGAVEERRLRRGRRHQRDRDRVRALNDVVHAGRHALHVRLDGQRNGAILHAVVDVLSHARRAQIAHHAVAEHLAVVHVDHAPELVAQRDHEARVLLQRRHGERLLVQLDRVGGVGERTHRALRPPRRLRVVPVGGHLVHLVEPLRAEGHGVGGGEVARLQRLQTVIARARQHLVLVRVDHRVHVQVRVVLPVRVQTTHRDGVLALGQTDERLELLVVLLRRQRLDGVHSLA